MSGRGKRSLFVLSCKMECLKLSACPYITLSSYYTGEGETLKLILVYNAITLSQ